MDYLPLLLRIEELIWQYHRKKDFAQVEGENWGGGNEWKERG